MKARGIIVTLGILVAAALAVCLALEYQAARELTAQNEALRRQLGQMAELTAENERLGHLLAQANAEGTNPDGTMSTNGAIDSRSGELARLRRQMEAFQQQSNDVISLRADTLATRGALKEAHQAQLASQKPARHDAGSNNGAALEILEADYGTARTNLEISAALNDRIRNGSLKIMAGNKLGGDPDFGQVKNLTVIYRYGGVVMTNQFREGDVVVLPPEAPAPP
jgi:hypothetical protein